MAVVQAPQASQVYIGLSTDVKPTTNISTKAAFYATDTKVWYMNSGGAWIVHPNSGANR